jgi:exodeoxyribonuclease VII large subunit
MIPKYVTVTALNRYLKHMIDNDQNLQKIYLKAEISNFKRHSRGHLYFTLKDDRSQISAVMFASQQSELLFEPKEGSKVLVEGYVSVYEVQGAYQFYVLKMSEDGIGDLYQKFLLLKDQLQREGLFDEKHKRPLPPYPQTIGVITSPTGAAVRDIIHIINRRFPRVRIIVYPALVQGDGAKGSIQDQIEKANAQALADVLIVGRGGGSIEDLWAFNEENVARAIYHSHIPVISAVGHETDMTIADYVSDLRAPTPSAAAEIVVRDQKELADLLEERKKQLVSAMVSQIQKKRHECARLEQSSVLVRPMQLVENADLKMEHLQKRLILVHPKKMLERHREYLNIYHQQLRHIFPQILNRYHNQFQTLTEKLELVNPLHIMRKGYSIVHKNGGVVPSVQSLDVDDQIQILMHDGRVDCKVETIRKDENNES